MNNYIKSNNYLHTTIHIVMINKIKLLSNSEPYTLINL